MTVPVLINGRWTCYKDPDDQDFYFADITRDLADRGTTAISTTAIVSGVSILTAASVSGNIITAKLGGLDTSPSPVNYCTFRTTCANTAVFDRTIWFIRVDN